MCTFCKTGEAITFELKAKTSPDSNRIQAILNACPERDDPRLLARMAFGITSPRLTTGKWSTSNSSFGTMVDVEFNALVAAFDVECKKAGYIKADTAAIPTSASKKRTVSQAPCSGGYYGGGETSKRGRYCR